MHVVASTAHKPNPKDSANGQCASERLSRWPEQCPIPHTPSTLALMRTQRVPLRTDASAQAMRPHAKAAWSKIEGPPDPSARRAARRVHDVASKFGRNRRQEDTMVAYHRSTPGRLMALALALPRGPSESTADTVDALSASMTNLATRRVFLCVALLAGCHAHAYYYEPALPPPPPMAPPPGAPLPPPVDDSTDDAAGPVSSSTPSQAPRPQASTNAETHGQTAAGPLPPLPSQAPQHTTASSPSVAPSASEWVHSYPEGQWVYHSTYGWIWIPADATAAGIDGVPYTYLYTPRFGWTWYVSPWGWGQYHYGSWVTRPAGWRHVWVAHPHIVVRLGRPRRHR